MGSGSARVWPRLAQGRTASVELQRMDQQDPLEQDADTTPSRLVREERAVSDREDRRPMNYITRLQHQLASANASLRAQADAIQAFRVHLASSKFASPGPDGERCDWIAVSDVLN
jgi:hypothetical protein